MRRIIAGCALTLVLSGCATLIPSPGEPTKKYTIGSLADGTNSSYRIRPHQLIVDLPTLYPPIDNTRIAVKLQAQTIDYFADVEWADRLSSLIQESLIYSLQSQKALRGVSRPTEGIHADYILKVEVRKFYVDQKESGQSSTAQVDYMVHLVKLPERHIEASHQFTHTQSIPEQSMDNIVNSLNTAHLAVVRSMVEWVVKSIH